jgi:gluconate 2-dehydrogenase gamma chain
MNTFFDAHQRATIEAAMSRIIPSDHEGGAREARTVDFVDRYLSGIDYIYARPDGSGFETLRGRQAQAWQTRVQAAREKYLSGVAELDRVSQERHSQPFVALKEDLQDDVLRILEHPGQGGANPSDALSINFGGPVEPALQQTSAEQDLDFFGLLVTHTRQGFYADPIYGGNHNRVGWDVIGFPGPASLAEVHKGRYSALEYFAENRQHPGEDTPA